MSWALIAIVLLGLAFKAENFGATRAPAPGIGETEPLPGAEVLTGRPSRITDGDTLRLGDVRIRLQGIDAPELSTVAGMQAKNHLEGLIGTSTVSCRDSGQRSYGRVVAVCAWPGGDDLGAAMVADGWAVDLPRFSGGRYRTLQLKAQQTRRGLYASG